MNIARMEKFEALWSVRHDLPAESLVQYRFESREGYRLPELAAHYRTHCEVFDLMVEENERVKSELRSAIEFQPIGEACLTNHDELRASLGIKRGESLNEHVLSLRNDAERYRWFRDCGKEWCKVVMVDSHDRIICEHLDESIDAAMGAENET